MNRKRLSFLTKAGYGLGQTVISTHDTVFNTFILFYYTQVLGLSGSMAGMAIAIAICFDAVTDPVMGFISDNFRSRYGRRHFFMAISGIPLAVSVYAMFAPPLGLDQTSLFVWMVVCMVLARGFYTIFGVPYLALGAEITEDYVERTTISTYRITFGWFVAIVVLVIAYVAFFPNTPEFEQGQMNPVGYPHFGLFIAVVIAIMALACVYLTRKEIPFLQVPAVSSEFTAINRFFSEVKMVMKNNSFRIFFSSYISAGAIMGVNLTLALHINTYFWELNSEDLALLMSSMLVSAVLAFILMKWIEKFDKKNTFLTLGCLTVFANILIVFRLLDLLPANNTSLLFWMIYLQSTLSATAAIMVLSVMGSILADAVDEGELENNIRQEGLYFAFLHFGSKMTTALGAFLAGLIIDFIQLPTGVAPDAIDPEVIWNLGFIYGPIVGICWLIPVGILYRLRLTRERLLQIRQELDNRKKKE
ncbi:MAG: MFS transporter [Deltaproteobacteria bacterium]|nr:MFS transporter [Deltaproteobacteria bacterium]